MTNLFTSRKFWAAIIAVTVIVLASLVPGFSLDEVRAVDFVLVIAAYIFGVAVDPGPGGWRGVLQSRKFWAAVIGFLILFLQAFGIQLPFDITPDQLTAFMATLGAYIVGVALEQPKIGA